MCDKHFTIEKNKQTYCLSCKKILIESKHLAFCNKCNNYTKYIYLYYHSFFLKKKIS